jgi:hypothetical protein
LKRLDGGAALENAVTIIGTKYCVGAHDYVIKASRIREPEEQCLYLVLDTKSSDVLLHNGKIRLGVVAPHQADQFRAILKRLAKDEGADHVLVCKTPFISDNNSYSFKTGSSFNVVPVFSVYERLARKFSNKYRKV